MFFYLAENKQFADLEQFGFRDSEDCYIWSVVNEDSIGGLRGQVAIKVNKTNRVLTFIWYGGGFDNNVLEDKAKQLYSNGLIEYKTFEGSVKIPNFKKAKNECV